MERIHSETLMRIDFRFGKITPDEARIKQYELEKDERVWRIFLNGYAKNGFVVFEEGSLPKEELLEKLKEFEPEIRAIKRISIEELIESSYSWNNIRGRMAERA